MSVTGKTSKTLTDTLVCLIYGLAMQRKSPGDMTQKNPGQMNRELLKLQFENCVFFFQIYKHSKQFEEVSDRKWLTAAFNYL